MMNSLRSLCAVTLLIAAASCNSYVPRWSTNPDFNNPVGSFTLTLDQTALDVSSGSATVNATVTPAGGFTGVVEFSPVNDEIFGLVITPGSVDIEGTTAVTIPLTLTVTAATQGGSESIQIAVAVDNQGAEASLQVSSTVVTGGAITGPDMLTFVVGGPAQDAMITATGEETGPFTESDTCAGIATVTAGTMAASAADYSVAPLAAGTCAMTVTDTLINGSAGQSKVVNITVTAN